MSNLGNFLNKVGCKKESKKIHLKREHKECEICGRYTVVKCSKCGKDVCLAHVYQYVDESNIAITRNLPMLCAECYIKTYQR